MSQIADYEYDVFISYPNSNDHKRWLEGIFLEEFEHCLFEELGRPPRLFYDKKSTESGADWPHLLKYSLSYSRIIIPIWSAKYFNSEWYMNESYVMWYREVQLGYRTLEKPYGLIH